MRRTFQAAASAAVVLALAGCGGGGLDAEGVVDELNGVYPVVNPRDNTDFCGGGDEGCEQLIAADPLSVYEWGSPEDATRFVEGMDGAVAADRFALRFNEDYPSSDDAIAGYQERFRQVVTDRG